MHNKLYFKRRHHLRHWRSYEEKINWALSKWAYSGGPAVESVSLQPLEYCDRGFDTRWSHGCSYLCLFCVVYIAVSAMGSSLLHSSPTRCLYLTVCDLEPKQRSGLGSSWSVAPQQT